MLYVHSDFLMRAEDKRHLTPPEARNDDELIALQRERVEREEPLFAEEDKLKRQLDGTGSAACSGCGRKYSYLQAGLCKFCREPQLCRRRNKGHGGRTLG